MVEDGYTQVCVCVCVCVMLACCENSIWACTHPHSHPIHKHISPPYPTHTHAHTQTCSRAVHSGGGLLLPWIPSASLLLLPGGLGASRHTYLTAGRLYSCSVLSSSYVQFNRGLIWGGDTAGCLQCKRHFPLQDIWAIGLINRVFIGECGGGGGRTWKNLEKAVFGVSVQLFETFERISTVS